MAAAPPEELTVIKVAGAISGVISLRGDGPTVGALRTEAARVCGVDAAAAIKLICSGKTLLDDAKLLTEYNVGPASRVLVTKGAGAAGALNAAAAEEERLDKLKTVVEKLSGRGDGRGLTDKYEFELQNQAGTRLTLAPADRKALVMGLALHSQGQASLAAATKVARRAARGGLAAAAAEAGQDGGGDGASISAAPPMGRSSGGRGGGEGGGRQMLTRALEELLLAEEAFDLVADKSLLQAVDNVAMLLLDIVWCSYLLSDIGRLGVSAGRLARARAMLARAHGANLERLRVLHGGFSPEAAIYVRLEAMEGVVAFHSGDAAGAARHLAAAQDRWQKLQVSADSLSMLREMGYDRREATRALRFCAGDVAEAVNFIGQQRIKQEERAAERQRQRAWLSERAAYGKTPAGVFVDREGLEQLATLGYARGLAAEALRAAENDLQPALDALTDPVRSGALQLALVARQIKEAEEGPQDVSRRGVRRLVEMGFAEKAARVALKEAGGEFEAAVETLMGQGEAAQAAGGADAAAGQQGGKKKKKRREEEEEEDEDEEAVDSEEERLEASLVAAARGAGVDPLAAYDLDLREESAAIEKYMAAVREGRTQV